MQKITSLLIFVFLPLNSSFSATFDYICRPMYSSVERGNVFSSGEVQGYIWSAVDHTLPEKVKKKFYSVTPFGQIIGGGPLNSERWSNMWEGMAKECFRYRFAVDELKPNPACNDSLFISKAGRLTDLTLYQNYCHSKMAYSVDEMFTGATDVPAGFINMWDEQYLTRNYITGKRTNKDLDIFFQLNKEAQSLWIRILNCENQNPERGRAAVASGNFSCPEIKTQFRNLVVNVANYFSSSQAVNEAFPDVFHEKYVPGTISNDSPLLAGVYALDSEQKYIDSMAWDGKKKLRNGTPFFWMENRWKKLVGSDMYKANYQNMMLDLKSRYSNFSLEEVLDQRIQIHPLFSQILIEILAARFLSKNMVDDFGRVFKDKYATDFRWIRSQPGSFELKEELKNLDNNISDFTLTYLERMCEPAGLWPSAGFSALLKIQRKISLALPLDREKVSPLMTIAPDVSGDFRRLGYWAFDLDKAQLNCRRDKVLPSIYYKDVKAIIKRYSDMFRRHISE